MVERIKADPTKTADEIRKLRKRGRRIEAAVAAARRSAAAGTGPRLVGLSDADWAQARRMMTCVNVAEAS